MSNHLWFVGTAGAEKDRHIAMLMREGPTNARLLSGEFTVGYLAELLQADMPPSLVVLDVEDGDSWAVPLHNATACGGHMLASKSRGPRRFVVPSAIQLAVFSPTLDQLHIHRLSPPRGHFQIAAGVTPVAATVEHPAKALGRLVQIAKSDTGQAARVANFLLAWWNAGSCGGFDLTDLWAVDRAIADDMLTVAGLIARRNDYPDAYGLRADFEQMVADWRPHLVKGKT